MRRPFRLITGFPKTTVLILIGLTVLIGFQLPKLRMETDADSMIPQDHPAIIYNDEAEEIFGIQDAVIIGIVNEGPEGIFNSHTLHLVKRLTESLAALDGVIAFTDDDVMSLSTLDNIAGTEFGFEVTPFMEEVPETPLAMAELRKKIYDNGLYIGSAVSQDGTATAIYAELEDGLDNRTRTYKEVKALVAQEMENGGPEEIYIAGRPVLEVTFGEYMAEDMQKMMPLVLIVVIIVLFITFRSIAGVLLPFCVVIGSVIWAMGTMALFKVPLYTISTQMPVILVAVGTAYSIHILNKFFLERQLNPEIDKREIILKTMDEMWKPVVMTALTTAVGFISLITAYMVPIRYFGVFTSVGVMAAMVFSLALLPACLMIFRIKVRKQRQESQDEPAAAPPTGLFQRILARGGEVIFDQKKRVLMATIILTAVAVFGLLRISTNSSWIEGIKHTSEVYVANAALNDKFDGTLNLYVVVEGRDPDAIKSPELLRKIDQLQIHMEKTGLVGGSRSIAEYLKRMNRVMNEDQEAFEVVPDSRELVAQYLLMYSMSGDPDDFDDVVDYDYRQANIWMQIKSDYTDDLAAVIHEVETYTDTHFTDQEVTIHLAGRAHTSFVWVHLLIRGQMNSILFSVLAVFAITAVMFRSLAAGLFNIVPISAAMLLNFGFMGLLGFPLDVSTALSSGIVIGVGIDYTIHFLSKYRLELASMQDGRQATISTMSTTGRAIFYNAVAVIAGFMVLYASNFPTNRQMGGLVSINMFTCFLAAVTILPALLNIIKPKFVFKKH